jgi:hypothetical protein
MMDDRRTATAVGWLFITGTVAGVASLPVTGGLLDYPVALDQVTTHADRLRWGAVLMLVMAFALAMVSALLYPILRRRSQPLAIWYVIVRGAIETMITVGFAISWLLLVTTAQQSVGAGDTTATQLQSTANLLVKGQDPLAALGSVIFALGALALYYLLYDMKVVPRWLSGWGLVGAILYLAAGLIGVFGGNAEVLEAVLGVQEMVMAVWLIVRGFEPYEVPTERERNLVAG